MYTVAVRTLCGFAAREGDLDLRFTPSPSALEGMEGHRIVAARRGAGYQSEVRLSAQRGTLEVRGRADGWDPARGRLEEVKTYRGRLDAEPANKRALHWAQAEVYGALLCERDGLPGIEIALVYLDIDSHEETVLTRQCSAAELQARLGALCDAYAGWARREHEHRDMRDGWLRALAFPQPPWRPGQRELAETVWRAARQGRCVLAEAPTGIGKTIGTLYPALKAAAEGLDRVFFLTAKTSGRAVALGALRSLGSGRAPLRTLELVALKKACEHPDKACHGESCPLARGFYDRLPALRRAAVEAPHWDRAALRALALEHGLCPYWASHELARWADVVVADYNYFFDTSAMLHRLTLEREWRVALLVDEAHNLVPRAREMYSASLGSADLAAIGPGLPARLKRRLGRLKRRWRETAGSAPHAVLPGAPEALLAALERWCGEVSEHWAETPAALAPPAQEALFEALHLLRLAKSFDRHSFFDTETAGADARLNLRNVTPAPFLAERFAACASATLFSATLRPPDYHRRMLGLPEDTRALAVDSPFRAEQLRVQWLRTSTRRQHRVSSVEPIVGCIEAQYRRRPGNYLAFFAGYDYLDVVARRLAERCPDVPAWVQSRGMSEPEQARFLDRFAAGGRGVGFAVLGGAFAEGIDLPGERLIGAFVATLGLAHAGPVNEELRRRLDTSCGQGFEYVYLYPGLQRVVQAAGRIVRTPADDGVLWLIDDRFGRADVRALLPRWWAFDAVASRRPAPAVEA